jgi:2-succinyl-5-enolpyruvyl-6-hydroxy-3-cyclohexene-1-carboxylate synthase
MIVKTAVQAIEICAELGIRQAVLSPGSRSAALTLACTRHPNVQCRIISDERSAAFIALGMAEYTQKPVILVCTSGSAAYNYAPAVAEAFFRHIPLLVFTADRPPEWIDQLDGQTIRQENIYGNHIKKSYTLPVGQEDIDLWHAGRQVSEAVQQATELPGGPVHLNVPVREPFYPEAEEEATVRPKTIHTFRPNKAYNWQSLDVLTPEIRQYRRILIVAGQDKPNPLLAHELLRITSKQTIPVVADIIANLHQVPGVITRHDTFLMNRNRVEDLQPDLLITFGLSVIAKQIKLMLRQFTPQAHWHVQESGTAADTYQALTRVIYAAPVDFFKIINPEETGDQDYYRVWQKRNAQARKQLQKALLLNTPEEKAGEFHAVEQVINFLPDTAHLHLANSMAVRYANYVGLGQHPDSVRVFANRGTSGIDGSNSTAVGVSMASAPALNVLITGDLAFFYDRNAFWHNYLLPNLRIVLLNNHAGGIFRIIDGPSRQPELEEYFETHQLLNAENTARDFGMSYSRITIHNREGIQQLYETLPDFYATGNSNSCKLLEIVTESAVNKEIFEKFKRSVKEAAIY